MTQERIQNPATVGRNGGEGEASDPHERGAAPEELNEDGETKKNQLLKAGRDASQASTHKLWGETRTLVGRRPSGKRE